MNSFTGRFVHLLQRFTRSQRGNVAMIAGIALPVLLMISAGAIDLHNAAKVKSELQDALDAATLAAARSNGTTNAEVQKIGMASLKANMPNYFLTNPGDVASFTVNSKYEVQATATVQVKTIIANVFLPPYGQLFDDYLPMGASSNVLRASRNVEVAVALDITGSMKDYMGDLRSAAKELVKIVVQGDQKVFTTRMALIPYAAGVNTGVYADAMRGTLSAPKTVSGALSGQSSSVTPSSNSRSGSTITIKRNNHGLRKDDYITLSFTQNNNTRYEIHQITSVSSNDFTISRSSNLGSNVSYRSCQYKLCAVKVTSNSHGLSTGKYASIRNVVGMTTINLGFEVEYIDNDNIYAFAPAAYHNTYTRGGNIVCGDDGCDRRAFVNRIGNVTSLEGSTCVSERPRGSNAPSDSAPASGNWVGRSYLEGSNSCPTAVLTPLTSQVDDKNGVKGLNSLINGYQHGGSTAGQIGVEQAWYAISPTFGSIFPTAAQPNAYNTAETVKAAVLMTDGEFNTPFCQGVIANTATSGSGNESAHINCAATNGNPFQQAVAVCKAMKDKSIVVYTVAFNLSSSRGGSGVDTAIEVMEQCATSSDTFFEADDGTDLKEAFKSIGRDITRLRIAR